MSWIVNIPSREYGYVVTGDDTILNAHISDSYSCWTIPDALSQAHVQAWTHANLSYTHAYRNVYTLPQTFTDIKFACSIHLMKYVMPMPSVMSAVQLFQT